MSDEIFYANQNIKCGGVLYVKGEEVSGLSDENINALMDSGAISKDEVKADDTETGEDHIQTDEEKAKGQDSQESKNRTRQPQVGGENADSGESSIDEDAKNDNGSSNDDGEKSNDDPNKTSQYTVLKKFKAEGNEYKVDEIVEMTNEEAKQFIAGRGEGIIEKVESDDSADTQSDDNDSQNDPSKGL